MPNKGHKKGVGSEFLSADRLLICKSKRLQLFFFFFFWPDWLGCRETPRRSNFKMIHLAEVQNSEVTSEVMHLTKREHFLGFICQVNLPGIF